MDKTEIFVKMCEKAEEIQRMSPRVIITSNAVNMPFYDLDGNCWFIRNNEKSIWLPRQDQLQEMAFEHIKKEYPSHIEREYNYNTSGLETDFHRYLADYYNIAVLDENYKLFKTTTFEQLWLMFVMKKCYNKTWNGREGDGKWEE